jgi:tetratricopeptide (TPR) repeat protein
LLIGTGVALWQAGQARMERDRAEAALREPEELSEFMIDLFQAGDPGESGGESLTSRDVLLRGTYRAERLPGESAAQGRTLDALGRAHERLGRYDESQRLLERALEVRAAAHGPASPEVAATLLSLGVTNRRLARYDSAVALMRSSLAIQQAVLGAHDPRLAPALHELRSTAVYQGRLELADSLARRVLDIQQRALGTYDPATLYSLGMVAVVRFYRGDYTGAEVTWRNSVEGRRRIGDTQSVDYAGDLLRLGDLLRIQLRRPAESEPLITEGLAVLRKSLGRGHPSTIWGVASLAGVREARGDIARADSLWRESVDLLVRSHGGEDHPVVVSHLGAYAEFMARTGRLTEAETLARRALEYARARRGSNHPGTADMMTHLARVLLDRGRAAGAVAMADSAAAIYRVTNGEGHSLVALNMRLAADARIRLGRHAEAEADLLRALHYLTTNYSAGHEYVPDVHRSLADLYRVTNRAELALQHDRLSGR